MTAVRTPSFFAAAPVVGLVIATIALIADQVSKYVMVDLVMRPEGITGTPYFSGKVIDILPIFQLRMAWNTGISFSLFDSGTTLTIAALLIVQSLIMATVIWYMWQMDRRWMQAACGFIIGGGLGNIVDRVTMGAVADFLHFYWGDWHFPTFNVADTCITIGVIMWLLDAFVVHPQHTD
tara:strand:- start:3033 stop:3569 length:537 start_codon:yes stop_codon:yes gene_type:complete